MGVSNAPCTPESTPPGVPESTHVVQFYADDKDLIEDLKSHFGPALEKGSSAVVIATQEHIDALAHALLEQGIDTRKAENEGRYVALNAGEMLSHVVVDGRPDTSLFEEAIGAVLMSALGAARNQEERVVAFGEMASLLWAEGESNAAFELEKQWNDLSRKYSFSLYCAYPLQEFRDSELRDSLARICSEHSQIRCSHAIEGAMGTQTDEDAPPARWRRDEEFFQLFVDSVHDCAIFMLNPDGRVATWNVGAERIKGYLASEIIGRHFSCFYTEEDLRSERPLYLLDLAARTGKAVDEGWRVRKDGSRFWASVTLSAVRNHAGRLIGFGKVTRDLSERKAAEEALRLSEASLRQLSLHLLRTQDEERRLIGREMHDTLGQYLSMLQMKLDVLDTEKRASGRIHGQIKECSEIVEACVKEVRTVSYLMYPPMLEELGLQLAMPWYVEGFAKRSGVRVAIDASEDFERVPRDAELTLFRVLQECLTNIHKHSGSLTAAVGIRRTASEVILEVSDHGRGFPEGNSTNGEVDGREKRFGLGLRGMNERLRHLGGSLEISSSSQGSRVVARIPLPRPTENLAATPEKKSQLHLPIS